MKPKLVPEARPLNVQKEKAHLSMGQEGGISSREWGSCLP